MYEFGALSGTSKVDLELVTVETAQNFIASLQYNTDLFNAATADRMLAHFETLLAHILARPEIRLGELTGALAEAERRQKLAQEELLTQARLEKFKKTRRRGVSGV
jgi:non-ribosomal peptide synthetase component F